MRKRNAVFLRDVFILSLTAFGGPQGHLAMMLERLVEKRNYLTEKELVELTALCQLLPGPTSTQTITAIGMKRGGPGIALLTLFFWFLPAVTFMTLVSFFITYIKANQWSLDFLQFIYPVAVGFVSYAAFKITSKVVKTQMAWFITAISVIAALLLSSPWVFPASLIVGGVLTNMTNKEKGQNKETRLPIKPNWNYLKIFAGIFILTGVIALFTNYKPVVLFENFYRFGSLIFGGGQVLIPMMLEQFVNHREYMSAEEFMTGYGITQAMPGPVFSFAAFAGGLAMNDGSWSWQLLGSVIGTVGIFLPGTLLIFFTYPLWNYLKTFTVVVRSLEGINAAASGLVISAAVLLFFELETNFLNVLLIALSFVLLQFTRLPAPLLIVMALIGGLILEWGF
ncbi:MAG: chromate efflux transporter [Chitinophagaceae bacterium]|nr:MAG: chromate efflux transporter [Chitinophagaceae bacterium]